MEAVIPSPAGASNYFIESVDKRLLAIAAVAILALAYYFTQRSTPPAAKPLEPQTLGTAIQNDSLQDIERLLPQANLNQPFVYLGQGPYGRAANRRPIEIALNRNDEEIVLLLLKNGATYHLDLLWSHAYKNKWTKLQQHLIDTEPKVFKIFIQKHQYPTGLRFTGKEDAMRAALNGQKINLDTLRFLNAHFSGTQLSKDVLLDLFNTQLKDPLKCSVYLYQFDNPYLRRCGHTFEADTFEEIVKLDGKEEPVFQIWQTDIGRIPIPIGLQLVEITIFSDCPLCRDRIIHCQLNKRPDELDSAVEQLAQSRLAQIKNDFRSMGARPSEFAKTLVDIKGVLDRGNDPLSAFISCIETAMAIKPRAPFKEEVIQKTIIETLTSGWVCKA